jgi:hypothetical protein
VRAVRSDDITFTNGMRHLKMMAALEANQDPPKLAVTVFISRWSAMLPSRKEMPG